MKIFSLFSSLLFCICQSYGQVKELSFFYDRPFDNSEFKKIKKFSIEVDNNYSLYVKNKIVFEQKEDSIACYEILDKKYILISLFDTSYRHKSIALTYWKKDKVIIIPIKNPGKRYYVNIDRKCNSLGVIKFSEKEQVFSIKDEKTNKVLDLVVW